MFLPALRYRGMLDAGVAMVSPPLVPPAVGECDFGLRRTKGREPGLSLLDWGVSLLGPSVGFALTSSESYILPCRSHFYQSRGFSVRYSRYEAEEKARRMLGF